VLEVWDHELGNAALDKDVEAIVDGPGDQRTRYVVPVVALDDEINPGSRVAAIKVDVEGHEPQVLAGAQRIIEENPSIDLLIEHHNHERNYFAIEQLAKRGFSVFMVDHDGKPTPLNQQTLREVAAGEMLYCRRVDAR
jgi:hypothetical protein